MGCAGDPLWRIKKARCGRLLFGNRACLMIWESLKASRNSEHHITFTCIHHTTVTIFYVCVDILKTKIKSVRGISEASAEICIIRMCIACIIFNPLVAIMTGKCQVLNQANLSIQSPIGGLIRLCIKLRSIINPSGKRKYFPVISNIGSPFPKIVT